MKAKTIKRINTKAVTKRRYTRAEIMRNRRRATYFVIGTFLISVLFYSIYWGAMDAKNNPEKWQQEIQHL